MCPSATAVAPVYLLRIDQSGGAYDVSYDAWNYLMTGYSATSRPTAGGATAMQYENVDISNCADLIHTDDGKLPLSAANSMNFVTSCLSQSSSWVASNYALYNILDSLCEWGYDETCTLDMAKSNQASCPHTLGGPRVLTGFVARLQRHVPERQEGGGCHGPGSVYCRQSIYFKRRGWCTKFRRWFDKSGLAVAGASAAVVCSFLFAS